VVADEIGAVAIACDVSDPASVSAAVNKAAEAMGGLDGVVNAAGILAETGIADTTAEVFSSTAAVNRPVRSQTSRRASDPEGRRRSIVNIARLLMPSSSVAKSRCGSYCADQTVVAELAPNIRVNWLSRAVDRDDRRHIRHPPAIPPSHHRSLRDGATRTAGELAAAILFLTSDELHSGTYASAGGVTPRGVPPEPVHLSAKQ
jgi:NAD(P)-dependent dehydrogenase (short-subunit alcohol dehydrogenase family)